MHFFKLMNMLSVLLFMMMCEPAVMVRSSRARAYGRQRFSRRFFTRYRMYMEHMIFLASELENIEGRERKQRVLDSEKPTHMIRVR